MRIYKVISLALVLCCLLSGCESEKVQGGFPSGHTLYMHQGGHNV